MTVASRAPGDPSVAAYADDVAAFVDRHADLLAPARWESPTALPARELIAAAAEYGLFDPLRPVAGEPREPALWRAVALHTALATAGNGAPGAVLLTHLEVGTRLTAGLPACPAGLVDDLVRGRCTAALAATEAEAGSDLTALRTRLHRGDAGELLVTGEKWFISNGPYADHLLVLADDPDALTAGRPGPALVLVAAGTAGVMVEPLHSAGHPGLTARLTFAGVRAEQVLVPAGRALLVLVRQWIHERVMLAVRMSELAAAVLRAARRDAAQRHTFGRPLRDNQHVAFTLADLWSRVAQARALTRQAVRMLAAGSCPAAYAAAAKHRAGAVLTEVADQAVQLAGADGYTTGHPAERALRDAAGLLLAGGADELLLSQIERG